LNIVEDRARLVTEPRPRAGIAWSTAIGLVVIHLGALAGVVWLLVSFSLSTAILAVALYIASGLSISAGYHRLFSHRSYRVAAPVRWFFLLFGAASFQGSALGWSADHRAHHADTDGPLDPHAITEGVWWAHLGWLLRPRTASADVTHLQDLWAVRSVRAQHRFNRPLAAVVGLALPTALAWTWGDPWGGLLVAGFLRTALMLESTFCINSLAHSIGRRTYDPSSSAGDSAITALFTFGEGYHSFHHRFPFDYRNGISWWAFDPSKWLICTLGRVRLAHKLRRTSAASISAAASAAARTTG